MHYNKKLLEKGSRPDCWAAKVKLTKTQDRLKGHVNEFMFIQFVGDTIQSVYDIETNGDRQVD